MGTKSQCDWEKMCVEQGFAAVECEGNVEGMWRENCFKE